MGAILTIDFQPPRRLVFLVPQESDPSMWLVGRKDDCLLLYFLWFNFRFLGDFDGMIFALS